MPRCGREGIGPGFAALELRQHRRTLRQGQGCRAASPSSRGMPRSASLPAPSRRRSSETPRSSTVRTLWLALPHTALVPAARRRGLHCPAHLLSAWFIAPLRQAAPVTATGSCGVSQRPPQPLPVLHCSRPLPGEDRYAGPTARGHPRYGALQCRRNPLAFLVLRFPSTRRIDPPYKLAGRNLTFRTHGQISMVCELNDKEAAALNVKSFMKSFGREVSYEKLARERGGAHPNRGVAGRWHGMPQH